jgi:hypothetical protein
MSRKAFGRGEVNDHLVIFMIIVRSNDGGRMGVGNWVKTGIDDFIR